MSAIENDPAHDRQRLAEVARLFPDDGRPFPDLDLLAAMAAAYFDTDVVLINLALTDTVWFAGQHGLGEWLEDQDGVPVEWLGPDHPVHAGIPVRQAELDVIGEGPLFATERIQSYAAVPITTKSGQVVGSCYAMGRSPLPVNDEQIDDLRGLAHLALAVLEAPIIEAQHRHPCNGRRTRTA